MTEQPGAQGYHTGTGPGTSTIIGLYLNTITGTGLAYTGEEGGSMGVAGLGLSPSHRGRGGIVQRGRGRGGYSAGQGGPSSMGSSGSGLLRTNSAGFVVGSSGPGPAGGMGIRGSPLRSSQPAPGSPPPDHQVTGRGASRGRARAMYVLLYDFALSGI